MSKKILVTSDPHLTDNPRDRYRLDFFDALPDIISRRQADAVAILGDLTEEKDRHSARLVNDIINALGAISDRVPLLLLMGNHDYRNQGHPFFAFTHRMPNMAWVDSICTGSELPREFRSLFEGCLFLPHTLDYERDWADLIQPPKGALRFSDYRFIFAHNTFAGTLSNGRQLDGIPVSIFPKRKRPLVLSGDVHTPQEIGPVLSVGAPYTVDFGDDYDPRLIMVDGYNLQSISVKSYPQKKLIALDDLAQLDTAEQWGKLHAGDIVKVRCMVDDMGMWPSALNEIRAWANNIGVVLFRAEPVLWDKAVRRNVRVRAHDDAVTDETLVKQFGKRHEVEPATLKIGLEFLK